jgi:hypothetical protein
MNYKILLESKAALTTLADTTIDDPSTIRKIVKAARKVNQHLEDFEEARKKIAKQYGHLSEDGSRYEFGNNQFAFDDALDMLLKDPFELIVEPITQKEIEAIKVKPAVWIPLEWLEAPDVP